MKKEKAVQGKDTLIHQKKKKGEDWKLVDEVESTDENTVIQDDSDGLELSTSFHKTIPLGNWEFGRVGMGIRARFPFNIDGKDRANFYDVCREAIIEVLDREEALVKGNKRSTCKISIGPVGRAVIIWMDYGLTFKGRLPQETEKTDMSSSRYVPDGDDLEVHISNLQEELGTRVFGHKESVLNPGQD